MAPLSRQGGPLPHAFLCRKCGQEKPPSAFSQSQIQKWHKEKRKDRHNDVTPQNVGLCCKDHSQNPDERSRRCRGPCDRIRAIEHFSKAQRNELDPWCIECTEWRLEFAGDEVPTAEPGGVLPSPETKIMPSLMQFGYGGENEDEETNEDEDKESSEYEFDDPYGDPYGEPTLVSKAIDRLKGYERPDEAGKGSTKDTMSTMNTTKYALRDNGMGEYKSLFGSDTATGTMTGLQPQSIPTSGTYINFPLMPNSERLSSQLQSSAPVSNSTTAQSSSYSPADLDLRLSRLAIGSGIDHQLPNAQASYNPSSQLMPGRLSEREIRSRASQGVKESLKTSNSSGSKKPNPGSKHGDKWYKGDNRKVFAVPRKHFAVAAQDHAVDPHDSDSPDEIDHLDGQDAQVQYFIREISAGDQGFHGYQMGRPMYVMIVADNAMRSTDKRYGGGCPREVSLKLGVVSKGAIMNGDYVLRRHVRCAPAKRCTRVVVSRIKVAALNRTQHEEGGTAFRDSLRGRDDAPMSGRVQANMHFHRPATT
ncbi:hypothetical protein F4777DRAFT_578725 [Nemania sp. FL0916]|nr:hypothetical protein F4777DRAFT_578725 [Nemania sp. FL0916]